MGRTIITFFIVFVSIACIFPQKLADAKWTILREDDVLRADGIEGMLQDVHFMDEQNGLVVGNNGLILVTTDGGKTWTKKEVTVRPPGPGNTQRPGQPPGGFGRRGPAPLHNIYFMNEKVGFITGGRGTILKTEDAGKTWIRKTTRSTTPGRGGNPRPLRATLMGIQMINEKTGFIAGTENTILKTTDGGETWVGNSERIRLGGTRTNLENIWFVSPTTGWIIGSFGTLLRTTDSGDTWEKRELEMDSNLFGIHFFDENTGWISGQEGLILHTADGGKTWQQQKTDSYNDLYDITFVDAMVGWAAGDYGTVLHTTDGGKTWNTLKVGIGGALKAVYAIDKNRCWVVDDWGVIATYKK